MPSTISAIHVGLAQLGIDEDGKRALYDRVVGKSGLKAMDAGEHGAVLAELRRLGFQPATRRPNGRHRLSGPYARKLQALWIAAYNLGLIGDPDDRALESFVRRQTGLERERFLHHADDAAKVIEALKSWLKRDGGVDWSEHRFMPAYRRQPGCRIALAQWAKLHPQGIDGFWPEVGGIVDGTCGQAAAAARVTPDKMRSDHWIAVMNALGRRIRGEG